MKVTNLIHLAVPLLILHFLEEWFTKFYLIDPTTQWLANEIGFDSFITYLFGQILLFIFLAIILLSIYKKHPSRFLNVILGVICLFEVIHVYEAAKHLSYYSGLVTSIPLTVVGISFFINFSKKKYV
jgi:hypothetical protein